MWSWFGGASSHNEITRKEMIDVLQTRLGVLEKRKRHLQDQVAFEQSLACNIVRSNENVAMAALRRKKRHEAALEETVKNIKIVEEHIGSIQSVVTGMPTTSTVTKTPPVPAMDALETILCGATPWLDDEEEEALQQLKEEVERLWQEQQHVPNAKAENTVAEDTVDRVTASEERLGPYQPKSATPSHTPD